MNSSAKDKYAVDPRADLSNNTPGLPNPGASAKRTFDGITVPYTLLEKNSISC
jgi:hypothetical protein